MKGLYKDPLQRTFVKALYKGPLWPFTKALYKGKNITLNKSTNLDKNSQQVYLFINVFHLVSSIIENKPRTKILWEHFLGVASYITYGEKS